MIKCNYSNQPCAKAFRISKQDEKPNKGIPVSSSQTMMLEGEVYDVEQYRMYLQLLGSFEAKLTK